MCLSFVKVLTYHMKWKVQGVVSYVMQSTCVLQDLLFFVMYHLIDNASSSFVLCYEKQLIKTMELLDFDLTICLILMVLKI